MNIKNLRKNYDKLSKRERFILYDAAENRDDKSEMEAVLNASPKIDWVLPDVGFALEKLLIVRLIQIIYRLKHSRDALFWFVIFPDNEFPNGLASIAAYFYCVSEDVGETIYQELGLDNEAWQKKENELFDLSLNESVINSLMREIAFDESEMKNYFKDLLKIETKDGDTFEINITYEQELENMRKFVKKSPLKDILDG